MASLYIYLQPKSLQFVLVVICDPHFFEKKNLHVQLYHLHCDVIHVVAFEDR